MNTQLKIKFLQHLNSKQTKKGFTLIELLVVILIIGVLAAIALPNLLGQVAKGRQAEAKNNLGVMNRAQQAYRLEELTFAHSFNDLPAKFSWKYYQAQFQSVPLPNRKTRALYYAKAVDDFQDDVLDYGAGIMQTTDGQFEQVICEELSINYNNNSTPIFARTLTLGSQVFLGCDDTLSKQVIK